MPNGRIQRPHRPIRTCVGCRARGLQAEMIRLRRRSDGTVVPAARSGAIAGRSAYVCVKKACFDEAVRRRAIQRTLAGPHHRAVHSDPSGLWAAILEELEREVASTRCDSATSHRVRRNALVTLLAQRDEAGEGA